VGILIKNHRALARLLITLALGSALPALTAFATGSAPSLAHPEADPIPSRFLAFGDSITYGDYAETPYPAQLEAKLDLRVADSEVINSGNPGEATFGGSERITGEVSTYRPRYVLILEGTNDVTRGKPPAEVYAHLRTMIDNARNAAGVNDVQVMLATLIPRLDTLNDETAVMNQQAILPAAADEGVPVCDQWQAFYDFGSWRYLYEDEKHPNARGLQLIAETFYDCLIATYPEVKEEATPPLAWIESVPPVVECGQGVSVSWNGSDNLNWVVDYDVQAQLSGGAWVDWLLATQQTDGIYQGQGRYGDTYGFRVRARDLLGNEGEYSESKLTTVGDSVPPCEADLDPLPPAQVAPFSLRWLGSDACAEVVAYDVQYRAGASGIWQDWLLATPNTSGVFQPPAPQYGETYAFRVRAEDAAGNWMSWPPAGTETMLAQYAVAGRVYNVRHEPVVRAAVDFYPAALHLERGMRGSFRAYLAMGGSYDISVQRADRYGPLPARHNLVVNDQMSGLQFILPPRDDAVTDGGFESGNLNAWKLGGTILPTLTSTAHTGLYAVRLGGADGWSDLRQVITPGPALTDPVLSLMVRSGSASAPSTLRIELAHSGSLSPAVATDVIVNGDAWTHWWYDLPGLASEPTTLTLTVSGDPPLLVDEMAVGSSVGGGAWLYLPAIWRNQ
jgi:lysophospholipase L1-like esterase